MWNIRKLKEHLESQGELSEQYADYLDSVSRCMDIFDYHKGEAYEVMDSLSSTDTKAGLRLVFATADARTELEDSILISQAHLHAALQNSRAMYDILAQLLNALLVLEPRPIHQCYIRDVHQSLPSGNVKTELNSILNSYEYNYVNGFVNTIKHRNLIQCGQHVDFVEKRSSIRVKPFLYAGENYEQQWAIDVLSFGVAIRNKLIEVGQLLNTECGVGSA